MNYSFIQKNKKAFSYIAAILGFAFITLVYFSPILQGKRIKQHDIEMYKGMAQEIVEYREATGENALWTNSMFGGMPAWNISVPQDSNLMTHVNKCLTLGLPHPIGSVFISMLGFFILLLVLDCSVWVGFLGALAYGLTSYLYIIIGAGHNSKAMAMAYMAPVIAGIIMTYKGKFLPGSLLTAVALALQVRAGHLQITYYLLLIVIILVVAEFVSDIIKKRLAIFLKASVILVIAAIIGIMTNITPLYANYKYGQETMRGKPVLVDNSGNQTKGLDRDYITQWSYGIGETWSLMIPNAKGGASALIGNNNPALEKTDARFKQSIAQSNAYWGDQPGTSGPVYVGAIVVFLFILGCFIVKGKLKWGLLAATILSILLSWGKNFMGFTNFFLDYIPGYDKFRAVSMTLVIAEITMPLLGILALAEITKDAEHFKKNLKYFYISLGITAGFCLLFYIAPKLFFSFLSQGEAQQFGQMISGQDGTLYAAFASQLENVRVAIFRKDAIRSFLLIVAAAIPLFLYGKGKLKASVAFPILAVLMLIDLFPIDKRYLNGDNFIDKKRFDKPFAATAADKAILADKDLDFRVLNLTKDPFNDASTSYFHKSVGGYHGAKLRRYQDLISTYLSPEVRQFSSILQNASSEADLARSLKEQNTLNMLNTRYIIYNPNASPLHNPCAFGNAWTVNDIRWAATANEEFSAIAGTDLGSTAIIGKEFEQELAGYAPTDSIQGRIELIEYKPNALKYTFDAPEEKLVVFSEIWTRLDGWRLFVDGQESAILRANYLLRAARIPSGRHEITMHYEPKIWKVGNGIAFATSLLLILGVAGCIAYSFKGKKKAKA